jgi:uncharacterized protein (DUF433 family)
MRVSPRNVDRVGRIDRVDGAIVSVARVPHGLPSALDGGIYLQSEAAHLTGLPPDTVRRWLQFGHGTDESPVSVGHLTASFHDLVSLRVVAALRRAGLRLPQIKAGADTIRRERGLVQPLAWEALQTDGVSRYFPGAQSLAAVSDNRQLTVQMLVAAYLHGVKYKSLVGGHRLATSWEPPSVLIDPSIQRGAPCVTGSRVQIAQLKRYLDAGDTPAYLAELFELDAEDIRRAINWYVRPTPAA